MCVSVFVYHVHYCITGRPEKGITSPGTGVRVDCELLCGCWESNPNPLEERLVCS